MKKFILTAALSAMFFIGLTSMVSQDPPENTTCQSQCEVLVDAGVFSGQGVCMSACNTCLNPSASDTSIAVCVCRQIGDIVGLESEGFRNFGECVRFFKDFF